MTALTDQSWFWWAVGIVVGLPVILFLLSEVLTALQRSGSPMARPVALVRNYVVPSAAQPCPSNQSIRRAVAWLKSRVNATRDGFRNAAGHRCGFRGPTTPDDVSEPPTAGVGGTAVRVTRRSPPRAPVRRSMSTLRPSSLTRRNAELPTGTLASTR